MSQEELEMQEERVEKMPASVMERHAQTIITALVMALLTWVGYTVTDMRTQVAEMRVQVGYLQNQVLQGTDDRFKGTDWRREKERLDERFKELKEVVESNSRRLSIVERDHDRARGARKGD